MSRTTLYPYCAMFSLATFQLACIFLIQSNTQTIAPPRAYICLSALFIIAILISLTVITKRIAGSRGDSGIQEEKKLVQGGMLLTKVAGEGIMGTDLEKGFEEEGVVYVERGPGGRLRWVVEK